MTTVVQRPNVPLQDKQIIDNEIFKANQEAFARISAIINRIELEPADKTPFIVKCDACCHALVGALNDQARMAENSNLAERSLDRLHVLAEMIEKMMKAAGFGSFSREDAETFAEVLDNEKSKYGFEYNNPQGSPLIKQLMESATTSRIDQARIEDLRTKAQSMQSTR